MSKLWVLGSGQLGAMLRFAAETLHIELETVAFDSTGPLSLAEEDFITAEIEHWPSTPVTDQLSAHLNFRNAKALSVFANRLQEKQLFDHLGLANAPWAYVDNETEENSLYKQLGNSIVLKRCFGGYDGKGQCWLRRENDDLIPQDWLHNAIAEKAIPFDEEVSLVGARSVTGEMVFYPLTLNLHENGILLASIAPLERLSALQSQAEEMLSALMNEFNYIGVMVMECFRLGDTLLINEIAPRVHNSGHWTMTAASIDQFELHVTASMGLPLTQPEVNQTELMINLIGIERSEAWQNIEGATVFWYDKEVLSGRKVGHMNMSFDQVIKGSLRLDNLTSIFDERYENLGNWIKQQFS